MQNLQIYDEWEKHGREVTIGEKIVKLSLDLSKEMTIFTSFVLDSKNPKILGLINEETEELCLCYETKEGFYDKIPAPMQQSIEQKMLEGSFFETINYCISSKCGGVKGVKNMADYLICDTGRLEGDKLKIITEQNMKGDVESTYRLFESAYRIITNLNSCSRFFVLKRHSYGKEYVLRAVCDADEGEIYPVSILNQENKIYAEASEEESKEIRKEMMRLFLRTQIRTEVLNF